MQPNHIQQLIQSLSKLPGLGKRSARRAVLHLINYKDSMMLPLAAQIEETARHIHRCDVCGNIDSTSPCGICSDLRRDRHSICVVEDVADLWAIERSQTYKGLYHVLGGVLSAIDGIGPDDLHISDLLKRVEAGAITEVILATNATVEGQTTAHFISESLQGYTLTITRLAQGMPMGGELDYLDEGTLSAAFAARKTT